MSNCEHKYNLSIYKVIFSKITSGCRRYLEAKFIKVIITRYLDLSVRSRHGMFFVRALQLLVIAFHRTEPLNATVFHVTRVEE